MYNDYLSDNFYHAQFTPTNTSDFNENVKNQHKNEQNSIFSNMFSNLNVPEINSETLILFAIIFFAIYDDFDTDLIIILGILFFLGL